MYDLILPFPKKTKAPLYVPINATLGALSVTTPGTYTLTDAQGNVIASGSVDAYTVTDGIQVLEWKTVDGAALSLLPGNYAVEFLLNVTDGTNPRTYVYTILLNVPGSRAYTKYPTAMDLQVFLVGSGMLDNPPSSAAKMLDLDSACATAVSNWERVTGFHPFLAGPAATTRYFDPPGPSSSAFWRYSGGGHELDLAGGAISVASVVQNSNSYIIGTDAAQLYLLPTDAALRGRPYDALRFVWPLYGVPESIAVTAVWGYAAALPDDVWSVLLRMAAMELLPQLQVLKTGGLVEVKQENLTRRYAARNAFGPFDYQSQEWQKLIQQQSIFYTRKKIA